MHARLVGTALLIAIAPPIWGCGGDEPRTDDSDTLAALGCEADEVPRWDGSAWVCGTVEGTDTLATLDCAADEVPRWDGTAWVCGTSGNTDTLAALSCSAGEVPEWNGTSWACGVDDDTTLTATAPLAIDGDGNLSIAPLTSADIEDGTLVDADVSPTAAIDPTKIAGTAATLAGDQSFAGNTLVIDSADSRVGVGVATPTAALDVAGDVVSSGDYTFAAPRMRTRYLNAAAFLMAYPDSTSYDPVSLSTTGVFAYITSGSATYLNYLVADVALPDGAVDADGRPDCAIVDSGHARALDLDIELPGSPLEPVMSGDVWEEVYDRLASLVDAHRTTLVFCNTRRLAERLTRHLSDRLGKELVTSHHGSLSRQHRLDAEQRLKSGSLRALVATASLELGIDIGDVDLVCQIGSTRTIAAFLQRVGRSGHRLSATPKGRLFPRGSSAARSRCSPATSPSPRRSRPRRSTRAPTRSSTTHRSRSGGRRPWRAGAGSIPRARRTWARWTPTPSRRSATRPGPTRAIRTSCTTRSCSTPS